MSGWERALIGLGGVAGLLGVALSAAAAHRTGGAQLETAARFLLAHAPALVGAAVLTGMGLVHPGLGRAAGLALALGLALFAGDLCLRALRNTTLFSMAAPTGGFLLMIGWALIALSGFLPGRP